MSPWRAAIDQALLLQKQPGLAVAFRQAILPDGMSVLIRLASDEGGRRRDLAQLLELDEGILQAAAADYLHAVCLYPDSSNLRTLGLNPSADLGTAKEHHRLLLKWLHPDRNPDNQVFAERVNQAWSALKKSAKTNVAASAVPDSLREPEAPSSGRFPLFLWGLAGLVALLLALSVLPDSDIYVADSGPDDPGTPDKGADPSVTADAGALAKSLNALKLSLANAGKAVPSPDKPDKSQSVSAIKKPPVDLDLKAPKAAENQRPTDTVQSVKAEPPRRLASSAPAAMQSQPEKTVAKPDSVTTAAPPVPVPEVRRDMQAQGQGMVTAFRQLYRQGDIGPFMQLFSSFARNNRGGRQSIETDYARFFANSSSRKITFSDETWMVREGVVQFKAGYAATVRRKGELIPQTNRGRIELVMSEENGNFRIQQILLVE